MRQPPDSQPSRALEVQRIALCLQYDGSAFCGWQRQDNAPSVQERLDQAIAELEARYFARHGVPMPDLDQLARRWVTLAA